MNEIKEAQKTFDNLSITGYRIIQIFLLLEKAPRSEEDINSFFENDPLLARPISKDTLGIYLNTLREIGCEITRPTKKNDYKYVLKNHPFKLTLTKDDYQSLLEIFKYLCSFNDWKLIDNVLLFIESYENCLDLESDNYVDFHNYILKDILSTTGTSVIKSRKLQDYCDQQQPLKLAYKYNKGFKNFNIIPEYILIENKKLYLCCLSSEYEDQLYLRIDKIKNIDLISLSDSKISQKILKAKFKLTGQFCKAFCPESNDEIILRTSNEIIVESHIRNKFKFIQRILAYGENCILIEPLYLRDQVVSTFKEMLELYS